MADQRVSLVIDAQNLTQDEFRQLRNDVRQSEQALQRQADAARRAGLNFEGSSTGIRAYRDAQGKLRVEQGRLQAGQVTLAEKVTRGQRAFRNAAETTERLRSQYRDLKNDVSNVTLVSGALTVATGLVVKSQLDAALAFERARRALEVISGSQEKAIAQYQRLIQVSRLPGLNLEQALKASVQLQAIGNSGAQAANQITQFGNALALGGGSPRQLIEVVNAIRQMSAEGKILQEDLAIMTTRVAVLIPLMKEAFGGTRAEDIRRYYESIGKADQQSELFLKTIVASLAQLPRAGETAANAIENLQDTFGRVQARIGGHFLPAIKSATAAVEGFLLKVENDEGVTKAIATIETLILSFGGLTAATTAIITILPQLKAALSFLTTNPYGLAITAVASLIALYVTWKIHADQVSESEKALAAAIEETSKTIDDSAIQALTDSYKAWRDEADEVTDAQKSVMDAMQAVQDNVDASQIEGLTSAYDSWVEAIKNAETAEQALQAALKTAQENKDALSIEDLQKAYKDWETASLAVTTAEQKLGTAIGTTQEGIDSQTVEALATAYNYWKVAAEGATDAERKLAQAIIDANKTEEEKKKAIEETTEAYKIQNEIVAKLITQSNQALASENANVIKRTRTRVAEAVRGVEKVIAANEAEIASIQKTIETYKEKYGINPTFQHLQTEKQRIDELTAANTQLKFELQALTETQTKLNAANVEATKTTYSKRVELDLIGKLTKATKDYAKQRETDEIQATLNSLAEFEKANTKQLETYETVQTKINAIRKTLLANYAQAAESERAKARVEDYFKFEAEIADIENRFREAKTVADIEAAQKQLQAFADASEGKLASHQDLLTRVFALDENLADKRRELEERAFNEANINAQFKQHQAALQQYIAFETALRDAKTSKDVARIQKEIDTYIGRNAFLLRHHESVTELLLQVEERASDKRRQLWRREEADASQIREEARQEETEQLEEALEQNRQKVVQAGRSLYTVITTLSEAQTSEQIRNAQNATESQIQGIQQLIEQSDDWSDSQKQAVRAIINELRRLRGESDGLLEDRLQKEDEVTDVILQLRRAQTREELELAIQTALTEVEVLRAREGNYEDLAEKITTALQGASNKLNRVIENDTRKQERELEKRRKQIEKYANEFVGVITNSFNRQRNAAEELAERREEIENRLSERLEDIEKARADTIDDINEESADKIEEIRETLADKIVDIQNKSADKIKDIQKDLSEALAEIDEDLADKTLDIRETLGDKITDIQTKSAEKIVEIQETLADTLTGIDERSADRITDLRESLAEKVQDIADGSARDIIEIRESLNEKLEGIEEKAVEDIVEIRESLNEKLEEIDERAADRIVDLRKSLTERLEDIEEKAAEDIVEIRESLNEKLEEIDEHSAERITDLRESLAEKVQDIADGSARDIIEIQESLNERLEEIEENTAEKIVEIQETLSEDIEEIQQDSADRLLDIQQDLNDKLVQTDEDAAEKRIQIQEDLASSIAEIQARLEDRLEDFDRSEEERRENFAISQARKIEDFAVKEDRLKQRIAEARANGEIDTAERLSRQLQILQEDNARIIRRRQEDEDLRQKRATLDRIELVEDSEARINEIQEEAAADQLALEQETQNKKAELQAQAAADRLALEESTNTAILEAQENANKDILEVEERAAKEKTDLEEQTQTDIADIRAKAEQDRLEATEQAEEAIKEVREKAIQDRLDATEQAEEAINEVRANAEQTRLDATEQAEESIKEVRANAEQARLDATEQAEESISDIQAKAIQDRLKATEQAEESIKEVRANAEQARLEAIEQTEESIKEVREKAIQDRLDATERAEESINEVLAKAEEDRRAAREKYHEDLAAAQEKADEARVTATQKAEEAIATAKEKARTDQLAAEEKAAEDVAAVQEKAIEDRAEAQEKANEAMLAAEEKFNADLLAAQEKRAEASKGLFTDIADHYIATLGRMSAEKVASKIFEKADEALGIDKFLDDLLNIGGAGAGAGGAGAAGAGGAGAAGAGGAGAAGAAGAGGAGAGTSAGAILGPAATIAAGAYIGYKNYQLIAESDERFYDLLEQMGETNAEIKDFLTQYDRGDEIRITPELQHYFSGGVAGVPNISTPQINLPSFDEGLDIDFAKFFAGSAQTYEPWTQEEWDEFYKAAGWDQLPTGVNPNAYVWDPNAITTYSDQDATTLAQIGEGATLSDEQLTEALKNIDENTRRMAEATDDQQLTDDLATLGEDSRLTPNLLNNTLQADGQPTEITLGEERIKLEEEAVTVTLGEEPLTLAADQTLGVDVLGGKLDISGNVNIVGSSATLPVKIVEGSQPINVEVVINSEELYQKVRDGGSRVNRRGG